MNQSPQEFTSAIYGNALKTFLAEHKISVSTLAHAMQLSSRNTINRIFSGNSKFETVRLFHNKLLEHRACLHLSTDDFAELNEALDQLRFGRAGNEAHTLLRELFLPNSPETDTACICQLSTDQAHCGNSLGDILLSLADCKKIKLFLFGTAFPAHNEALKRLLTHCVAEGSEINIDQILCTAPDAYGEIRQFQAIHDLLDNPNYTCAHTNESDTDLRTTGEIVICRTAHDNTQNIARIEFFSKNSFAYSEPQPDPNGHLSAHADALHEIRRTLTYPLNPPAPPPEQALMSLLAFNEEFARYEQYWGQILVKPDLCIAQIPPQYMMPLLVRCGYMGLSPDSPQVKRFERIHHRRYENYRTSKHGYIQLCSEAGIRRFLESGRLSDHIDGLPPFTPDERRAIIEDLLETAAKKPGFILRVWKKDVPPQRLILNLFEEKMLFVVSTTQEKYQRNFVHRTTSHEAVHSIRRMLLQEIMPEFTLGEHESHVVLTDLLETYTG